MNKIRNTAAFVVGMFVGLVVIMANEAAGQATANVTSTSATAAVILAAATLVTALTGGFVLVLNAIRSKRIEEKVDAGAVVQEKIHMAVNSNMAAAVKKIDEGTAELRAAKEEISRLKADAVTEIKTELSRFREETNEARRQR